MLSGKKILLRAVEPADADLMLLWENDRQYWYVSGTTSPLPSFAIEEFTKSAYQDIHINRQLRLVVENIGTKDTVGYIDLFDVDFINRRAGVGVLTGNAENRNKGFASEAVSLIKNYAFEILNLNQLFCNIHESNKTSIRLFEKCGFEKCGQLKNWSIKNNLFEDVLTYQLIRQ